MHEDHKAPIVAVNIWYHVGSKDEKPGRTGFAHLFEHLMFNGSENRKDEFFRPLEAAGATKLNGTTWSNRGPMVSCAPWTTSHAGAARGAGKSRATRSLRRAEQRR